MTATIERPAGTDDLTEFILFQDTINSKLDAYWPVVVPMYLPMLEGEGPDASGRQFQPFVARENGEIVARALAIVDGHYLDHWNDGVGHVSMFEALPERREAVRLLMDEACGWLRSKGMTAARAGLGQSDFPFLVEETNTLSPLLLRQNPVYYNTLLKEAGFESERAWTDYRIEVTPEITARWESAVDAASKRGFRLVPYGDVPAGVRTDHWLAVWNEAFAQHWGVAPMSAESHEQLVSFLLGFGMGETSVIAYEGDDPVGVVWVVPELASSLASSSRPLRGEEKVNFLGIGVREQARGRGVNMAMASYAYLELVKRGATHVSYTLVLDDNWPSRRTAEKLGAHICANYMVYRRNFGR
jgi:GNAT superfamily N-acetyltransferase